MKRFFRSFRLRIFLIIILVGWIACAILSHGIIYNYKGNRIHNLSMDITDKATVMSKHLTNYDYITNSRQTIVNAELSQIASLYKGHVIVTDSDFRVIYDSNGTYLGKYIVEGNFIDAFAGRADALTSENEDYIEVTVPIKSYDYEKEKIVGTLYISVPIADIITDTKKLEHTAVYIEVVLVCIIVAIAFGVSYVIARPVMKISSAIRAIASFEDARLLKSEYSETEDIVDAFNELQTRLKTLDDSRQEFVSNVSHELKTPLTSIKVLADSLNGQENVPIDIYQEFMQDITKEIDRENSIITDLLSLVKMDRGGESLNVESKSVNELLELVMKRLGPIAGQNEVELIYESNRQVVAELDEVKMTLALTNLIENAIKYNKQRGWVRVTLDSDHQFFFVTIADSGIGIAQDQIDHIYERFYRVEKSHSREIGGTGLGLSLTRKTILLHRGSIRCESVPGEGTTFYVRIPLTYIHYDY